MTVSELIEELKKFDKDLNVIVQYRDADGEINGVDDELYLFTIMLNNIILVYFEILCLNKNSSW